MSVPPDLAAEMSRAATDAVAQAQTAHGVTLDYSRASIPKLETILGKIHDQYTSRGLLERFLRRLPTRADLRGAALLYGGYLGEVLRQSLNGTWEISEGIPAVSNSKGTGYPVDKAFKRMVNGPENSVDFFFARALEHLK